MQAKVFDTPFNTYTTKEIIGEGGSGIVYEVHDDAGNIFALKCLRPSTKSSEKIKRFKNEISFCQNQTHNNIIKIVDTGFVRSAKEKCPFYVMPKYHKTLRNLIDDGIRHDDVLPKFSQIIDGVEAAHLLEVWHRDLKPENILYDEVNDTLIISDFGIAHFAEPELATIIKTKLKSRLANFQYSAPEQRRPGKQVDHRTDIFSLGLILNEMFTRQIIQGDGYNKIESVVSKFSYLDPIVAHMVQQDIKARPNSLDDIKKELIAQRNEFISRQKVNRLQKKVVPKITIEDPLVEHPIEIKTVDYEDGYLVFQLTSSPNQRWRQEFNNPRHARSSIMGICSQEMFDFDRNQAKIRYKENYEQKVVDLFNSYLNIANGNYKKVMEEEARRKEKEEKEGLLNQIREERTRQQILSKIQF